VSDLRSFVADIRDRGLTAGRTEELYNAVRPRTGRSHHRTYRLTTSYTVYRKLGKTYTGRSYDSSEIKQDYETGVVNTVALII